MDLPANLGRIRITKQTNIFSLTSQNAACCEELNDAGHEKCAGCACTTAEPLSRPSSEASHRDMHIIPSRLTVQTFRTTQNFLSDCSSQWECVVKECLFWRCEWVRDSDDEDEKGQRREASHHRTFTLIAKKARKVLSERAFRTIGNYFRLSFAMGDSCQRMSRR